MTGCPAGRATAAGCSARRPCPLEVGQVLLLCQRLVEDTERVGEEGGGKLSSSSTATPTLLRRVNMQEAATHLLVRGLYFSMEFRLELPSLPPTAYSQPSMATRSWVLLEGPGRDHGAVRLQHSARGARGGSATPLQGVPSLINAP